VPEVDIHINAVVTNSGGGAEGRKIIQFIQYRAAEGGIGI
jgi:hypothetical protein